MLSKLLERLVVRQLLEYLSSADLLPSLQSGFRPGYSTETAVLRVLADILQAVDREDLAALVLLDLSAAFDIHISGTVEAKNVKFGTQIGHWGTNEKIQN